MKQFCHKCLTHNLEEGSCSNCGYTFNSTINERIEDLIYESTLSRMALSDEQEKAISRLERKLKKLDLRLEGGKMTAADSFSAFVQAGGKMYHINVGFDGIVQVDGSKVDPKKEDVLMGIFKSHQKLAEQPKEEKIKEQAKKDDKPAIQPQKDGKGKLFTKKKLAESVDVKPEAILIKGDQKAIVYPNGNFFVYEEIAPGKWQTIRGSNSPRYTHEIIKELEAEGFTKNIKESIDIAPLENLPTKKEEVVTDIGLVEDSYPEIVDQALKAGLDKEMAGKFANFMGDRFGKSYYDPSYTQEWIDRFKKGSAWANADSMTRAAMQAAGLHEAVGSDEAPKANVNPDAQIITDDGMNTDGPNLTDEMSSVMTKITGLGFKIGKSNYLADGIEANFTKNGINLYIKIS